MILVTADLHLNDLSRDAYRHKVLPWFREQAKQLKARCAIILGDLCEEKDRHPAVLVNTIVEEFYKLSAICPVIIQKGNHDYLDPNNPFYLFLDRIDGVVWMNKPSANLPKFAQEALGVSCLFLPHTNNYKRDWTIPWDSDWIFAHQTFQGATPGHGHRLDGIPLDVFPSGSRIVSGDIHVPQTIEKEGVRVDYVGAPCLVDFGDDYDPSIVCIEGRKLTRVRYPGPQKRLYECGSLKELEKARFIEGDIVKIKMRVSSRADWAGIAPNVRKLCAKRGVQPWSVVPILPARGKAKAIIRTTQARTDRQTFADYCKTHKISKDLEGVGDKLMENSQDG